VKENRIKKRLIILTPGYRENLNLVEVNNLKISLNLNTEFEHAFVLPEDLEASNYREQFGQSTIFRFPKEFFSSTLAYNELMKSSSFYQKFSDYHHILILQLDAILIKRIPYKTLADYDYVGSIWPEGYKGIPFGRNILLHSGRYFKRWTKIIHVGNGGLSFRKVSSHLELLKILDTKKYHFPQVKLNEDVYFAFFLNKYKFKTPTKEIADSFFREETAIELRHIPDVIGFHGLNRFNPALERKIHEDYLLR
jgi:hypothetical protein